MVQGEAAGGKYTVDVRMKLQALSPAMEHAEETDLGTEMPWILTTNSVHHEQPLDGCGSL